MILHFEAEVTSDRKLILTMPPEVPIGKVRVDVTVPAAKKLCDGTIPSLVEWAEQNAGEYDDPFTSEDVDGFTGRRF